MLLQDGDPDATSIPEMAGIQGHPDPMLSPGR
jgi:hypothetical protein